ncbi:hypothetical protein [Sulfurovum sp. TSL1]|uniref:hypothetical protein n=1 Tax=Sulfurovum sp. TSL1 TaxID=2826994 RepID=UPI001CC42184|nr:hypothetical protein [Sulfurovum sp. TSL1]GIT97673.1 hypothetical protein TSL1_04940 [Sulfurovum sp. TSL1]
MPRVVNLALLLLLSLTACTPHAGVGVGGVVASSNGIAATEVVAETQNGVHGNVFMGTELGL